jgi:Ca2+-binding RTX toxin-like protein
MVTVIQGAGFGMVTGSHAYATGGIFNVTLTLTDDDTGADQAFTTAVVTGVGLTPAGILQIIGSNDDDRVTIAQTGNAVLRVFADFLLNANFKSFNPADVVKIIAYLCDGGDYFVINTNVAFPAIVHGGDGDDLLKAGGGPSVLLGDDGDDHLIGGNGRDIMIGGLGADLLMGGLGEDILIGGTTTHDQNDMALMDLITEWNAPDPYAVRVDRLRNGTGATGIQLAKGVTVFDDADADLLVGSFGTDWFFFDLLDKTPDKTNSEAAN